MTDSDILYIDTSAQFSVEFNAPKSDSPEFNVEDGSTKNEKLRDKETVNKLKCFLVNARSLVNKVEEMKCHVYEHDPDIIMITETWAKEHIGNAYLQLEGYEISRNDRNHKKGGGCLIYSKESLNVVLECNLTYTDKTDTVWIKLKTQNGDICIGVCYHSTSATAEEEVALHELISRACITYKDILICGDFNHRTINWDLLRSQVEGQAFLDLTLESFLIQHVRDPTRGENILDLVLSSQLNMIDKLVVQEPFGTSDHNVITFDLVCDVEIIDWKVEYYGYRNGDYAGMRKFLDQTEWDSLMDKDNVKTMWNVFKQKIHEAVEIFVPKKTRKKRKKPMWWNWNVYSARKRKLRWWKKYCESKQYQDYLNYKRALNRATSLVKKAKRKLERKLAKNVKSDPKGFLKYARSKTVGLKTR